MTMRLSQEVAVRAAAATLISLTLITCALALPAEASPAPFNISQQALSSALAAFAEQSHEQLLYTPDVVANRLSSGVRGTLEPTAALEILLKGTGLTYSATPRGAILVGRAENSNAQESSTLSEAAPGKEAGKSSQTFRLAQLDQKDTTSPVSAAPKGNSGSADLAEIIVTAEKREERVQDVPIPMTAVSAENLVQNSMYRLQDYYNTVPGLNLQFSSNAGAPSVSIRGITTGGQANPSVGITVDDVPYGASTFIGGGFLTPDIDPSSLSRVEVLRGPQGTLYGAASIGGLIKYVTVDPTTDAVSGRIETGLVDVYHGAQMGYSVRGAVNLPVNDTMAVRVSGFTRLDPGYIDNVQTGDRGVNWANVYGGLLSGLWRPSDAFSVKLTGLLQVNESHGAGLVTDEPGLGDWQQSFLRGTGGYDQRFQEYSATVKAKLAGMDFTSITGYGINASSLSYDITSAYGFLSEATFPNTTDTGASYFNDLKTTKVSQEFRLASSWSRLDWLVGLFYTHESSSYISDIYAEDPTTGAIPGKILYYTNPSKYQEFAGFVTLTYHITDAFDVQVGGREASIRQSNTAYTDLPAFPPATVTPNSDSKDTPFTYLFTPRYRLGDDFMVYARLASGYRPGGPNANAVVNNFPASYSHDTTHNFDLGIKADFLDHRLSVDAAAYYIDWKNVQVTVIANEGEYISNGGGAKSQGLELSLQGKPVTGLTVAGWVAYNDADLTKPLPPGSLGGPPAGLPGDRLPSSSRWTANTSVEEEVPLGGGFKGFARLSESFVSDYFGAFPAAPPRAAFAGYWKTDLRVGARSDEWTVNLYANNVTNRRAILDGGADFGANFASPNTYILLQPRTVGVTVARSF